MIIANEEDEIDDETMRAGENLEADHVMEDKNGISIHAIIGNRAMTTLKIVGMVKKRGLTILIDSGSTHSFLDCDTVRELKCELIENTH